MEIAHGQLPCRRGKPKYVLTYLDMKKYLGEGQS